jgi:hypothetical protein
MGAASVPRRPERCPRLHRWTLGRSGYETTAGGQRGPACLGRTARSRPPTHGLVVRPAWPRRLASGPALASPPLRGPGLVARALSLPWPASHAFSHGLVRGVGPARPPAWQPAGPRGPPPPHPGGSPPASGVGALRARPVCRLSHPDGHEAFPRVELLAGLLRGVSLGVGGWASHVQLLAQGFSLSRVAW